MKNNSRFLKISGVEAYTGNELLLKGALEAGVAMITGYPGSPVSEVFDAISEESPVLAERGMVAQIANNEALACARLNGARQAGLRAMAIMKSVGFHVGADGLATGNLMEHRKPQGGAIVVVGDDPWNETTQINSDSRYLSKHLHMPLVEPSTFQEIKDWIDAALSLSGVSDLYVTYLITTNQADGGGTVEVRPHPDLPVNRLAPGTLSSEHIEISDTVMIPPHTSMREATLAERQKKLLARARELKLNRLMGPPEGRKPLGFVTSGASYCYLENVLRMLGLWDSVLVLKLGLTYPLDEELIEQFSNRVEHVVVVEEKRGFLEGQIAELFVSLKQAGRLARVPALWGKMMPDMEDGFPANRGLNASIILEVLGPQFLKWKQHFPTLQVDVIEKELAEIVHTRSSSFDVPLRTPTFCPGCPHRDSSVVSLELKGKMLKANQPKDLIFHGESGCHSMLQFAPNEGLMQNYSGMGLGGGTGAGMAPFVTNKQVVFLGDSTFFHSGIVAVSDSLKNNQDITYIILQNDTTAMTGHQPTPGNSVDVMGQKTPSQNIEKVLRGMFPENLTLHRLNPSDRVRYAAILEQTVAKPGVKVIIADKECAITYHRRLNAEKKRIIREQGFLAREEKINITPDVCEYCLECTRQTACPGLTVENTIHGPKITTDLSTCVDDGACSRTKACPSFEKIIITRRAAPVSSQNEAPDFSDLPTPYIEPMQERWSAYTAAVGGMGAGVVNAVLVRAGMNQGYDVSFLDKKGLAIRNGGVYGHVVFSSRGPVTSPVIPYGKADLLIGLDILESARALDARTNLRVAHPGRTRGVINNHKHETVLSLMGRNQFDPDQLEKVIQSRVRLGGYVATDFSSFSEKKIGSKLYANMMVLGAAFQKGWIPIDEANLIAAIGDSVRASDVDANFLAFKWGRYLAVHPDMLRFPEAEESVDDMTRRLADLLGRQTWFFKKKISSEFSALVTQSLRWMDLPLESQRFMTQAIYDLARYESIKLAKHYVGLVWAVYRKDQARFDYQATHAVLKNLYKVIAIKDEVWVAALLTSPEKYERDRQRYRIDPSRGDRVRYVHLNRPQFSIAGVPIEFDINARDWMLRMMANAKFLRRLLPGWHAKEKAFRDAYIGMVNAFTFYDSAEDYQCALNALSVPQAVRGYRTLRYPLMAQALEKAQKYMAQIQKKKAASQSAANLPSL